MRLPNGFGAVINLGKRRRKPYAVRLTIGYKESGAQIFRYLGYYEKKKEALEALIEYNKRPFDLDKRSITFEEVFEAWSKRKFDTLGESSRRNYRSIYNKCKPLYDIPFKDLKTEHLQSIVDEHKKLSNINLVKVLYTHLYYYALKNDIVEKDYSKYVEIPVKEVKKKKQPFTAEEVERLWKHQDKPFVDIVLVLLYTGMRITELLEMPLSKVYPDKRYMVGGKKTKAGRDRIIPIHKDILPFIEKAFANNKKWLFETSRGNSWQYNYFAAYKFTPLMEALEMSHTLHETRHTFISQASRLNINQSAIKKIVGHASGDITEHYTHKNIDELIEAVDGFYY